VRRGDNGVRINAMLLAAAPLPLSKKEHVPAPVTA